MFSSNQSQQIDEVLIFLQLDVNITLYIIYKAKKEGKAKQVEGKVGWW